jgi:small subunit ribosomal protein S12e
MSLVGGLREAAKAIVKHSANMCILAEDCDRPDYVKLVKALCGKHNVHLITVPNAKTIGEWAGVSPFVHFIWVSHIQQLTPLQVLEHF